MNVYPFGTVDACIIDDAPTELKAGKDLKLNTPLEKPVHYMSNHPG